MEVFPVLQSPTGEWEEFPPGHPSHPPSAPVCHLALRLSGLSVHMLKDGPFQKALTLHIYQPCLLGKSFLL